MNPTLPAILFTIMSGVVMLFQLGLALGLPWGSASMGGKFPGKYPLKMRFVAGINILILGLLILIVLVRAELLLTQFTTISKIGIWFVVAFSVIGTILNTITPSKIERIWAPVAGIQLIASLIVALS